MDLLNTVRKEGSRGGRGEFKWSDVQTSQHRENYLGHSLMAPVGRWSKGKDLSWYAKGDKDGDGEEMTAEQARKAELKKVKDAEENARRQLLGLPPLEEEEKEANNPNLIELPKEDKRRRDRSRDGERRHRRHRDSSRDRDDDGRRRRSYRDTSRERDDDRRRRSHRDTSRERGTDPDRHSHKRHRSREYERQTTDSVQGLATHVRRNRSRSRDRHVDRQVGRTHRSRSREHHTHRKDHSLDRRNDNRRRHRDGRRDRSRSPRGDFRRKAGREEREESPRAYRRRKSRSGSSRPSD